MAKKTVEIEMDGAKKVVEVPEPLKRKCEIKDVLPVGVLQLLASAPHNETIRAVLLAHLKVPVPEELKTYKDIQDWIEFNIDAPKLPIGKMATPRSAQNMVNVLIVATDREHGSCEYHEDTRGHGNIPMSREDILEAAGAAEDSDDFFDQIRQQMYEDGVTNHISMVSVEASRTCNEFECTENDGIEVQIQPEGHTALKEILRQFDPDRYDELFG